MPPVVYFPHLNRIELTEQSGSIKSVNVMARVDRLTDLLIADTDWNILRTAMSTVGVPQPGDKLPSPILTQENDHLVVASRSPKLLNDKNTVDIEITYDHVLNGPYQDLTGGTPRGPIFGVMQTSTSEEETDKEPVGFNADGVTIRPTGHPQAHPHFARGYRAAIVAYGYPINHQNLRGQTEVQLGNFKAVFPQSVYRLSGWMDVADPDTIELYYFAKTNSHSWLGRPAETWLCTEVRWQMMGYRSPLDLSVSRYQFSFEFQYKSDGWQPGIIFIDKDTNKPPRDALDFTPVPVTGYFGNIGAARRIDYYSKIDFRSSGGGYLGIAEGLAGN